MTKKSASMSRDEFAEVINATGPFRFTVHGERAAIEKPFATLDEPRPYPLERAPVLKCEPGERMRRLDESMARRLSEVS
jgi:hypothetical protein